MVELPQAHKSKMRLPQIVGYLNMCAADLALVHTELHTRQVMRIYQHEPWMKTWTVHLHWPSRTPYAVRYHFIQRSIDFAYPSACPPHIQEAIRQEHQQQRFSFS